jgi:hypothetical protein
LRSIDISRPSGAGDRDTRFPEALQRHERARPISSVQRCIAAGEKKNGAAARLHK